MQHMEVLNQKLKNLGRNLLEQASQETVERSSRFLEQVLQEAMETEEFFPYMEAVRILKLSKPFQLLLCALWSVASRAEKGVLLESFWELVRALLGREELMDSWILTEGNYVFLSPVLYAYLEGKHPELPNGASWILPREEKAYGLEELLKEAAGILQLSQQSQEAMILCITAQRGSGRQFFWEQFCSSMGSTMLLLDSSRFQETDRNINACVLCASLYEAFLCVHLKKEEKEELLQKLSRCFGFYGMIKEDTRMIEEDAKAIILYRTITLPDRFLKQKIIEDILGTDKMVPQLKGKQLPIGMFLREVKRFREELRLGREFSFDNFFTTASGSLHMLAADRTFEELKLPEKQYEQLKRISHMIATKEEVMQAWGFGEKFSYGNGISLLFYGAPGTGKTMAAQVMANALEMPLYRVDLSQLISKYIGETQKNIGRVFDEADKCDGILLFDEADAIFSKRNEVSDAQDKYSNAETAYLLQRMEQYTGVSILATNLLQNFDEAFRRRISYMVHFPMPDVNLRQQLWETIFPKKTPLSEEIDFLALAQAFELSGASIKNAAFHGALLARAEGTEVKMKHILDGILQEYTKYGKTFHSAQKELLEAFQ